VERHSSTTVGYGRHLGVAKQHCVVELSCLKVVSLYSSTVSGMSWVSDRLTRLCRDLESCDGNISQDMLTYLENSLELAYRELLYLELTQAANSLSSSCDIVRNCLSAVRIQQEANYTNQCSRQHNVIVHVNGFLHVHIGRPSFNISNVSYNFR
jgi:hypothetical protein